MKQLIREASGNVVLRNNNIALRFFKDYGGTPLEFWLEPYPLLTNSFPGSGASWTCEVGQDPTQASANGLTPHPICCYGIPATQKYNYYIRESLFDSSNCAYTVSGFYPDFWLRAEPQDDYIRTWDNKTFLAPGNEMEAEDRIRKYPNGRIAFKTTINFALATRYAFAGAVFRANCSDTPSGYELESASGYKVELRYSGELCLFKNNIKIISKALSRAHKSALLKSGVELEVRTNNNISGALQVYINDVLYISITEVNPILGDTFALYYNNMARLVSFAHTQVFDLGILYSTRYETQNENQIVVTATLACLEPREMYRAVYGIFLNQQTFAPEIRATQLIKDGNFFDIDGQLAPLSFGELYAGHQNGSHGIKLAGYNIYIDNEIAHDAHALLQKNAINEEFVIMFNALKANSITKLSNVSMRLALEFNR